MSDPYFDNVSLLIPFDYSTAIPQDYSPNKKQVIVVGAATPDTQDSKFYGKSVSFDGRTGYIDIPPSQDFNFGTGDFTVEFWIKLSMVVAADSSTIYFRVLNPMITSSGANSFLIWINRGIYRTAVDWSIASLQCSTIDPLNDSQWHHVAFSRAAGMSYCALDGIIKSTAPDTADYSTMGTEGIRIAARGNLDPNAYAAFNMQDLRITKGVCRYTENFTPPDRFLSDTNLAGTVLTTEGIPKSGMTVRCIDRNPKIQRMWTTKTDKFGHYSFLLPKGDYTILAQDDNGILNDQVKRVRN